MRRSLYYAATRVVSFLVIRRRRRCDVRAVVAGNRGVSGELADGDECDVL